MASKTDQSSQGQTREDQEPLFCPVAPSGALVGAKNPSFETRKAIWGAQQETTIHKSGEDV